MIPFMAQSTGRVDVAADIVTAIFILLGAWLLYLIFTSLDGRK